MTIKTDNDRWLEENLYDADVMDKLDKLNDHNSYTMRFEYQLGLCMICKVPQDPNGLKMLIEADKFGRIRWLYCV